ncbi:MAG TPA: efflux RND transporter periplasmic adaptor subunit [Steroidobacteraceae bacterium]|nr:efflux RND transporter periplasmic adaptor subunit [Steroidobacteraceae bacterium]
MKHVHRAKFLIAGLLAATLSLTACNRAGGDAGGKNAVVAPPSPYATIANGKVDVEGGVIEVAARRPGVVTEVLVQEGDVVKAGQVLARQDDRDAVLATGSARAALLQAESQIPLLELNIRTAQREYERVKQLIAQHLISQQALDQSNDALETAQAQLTIQKAAVETAKAQVAQALYNQELTIVRAPMNGKIVRRYTNPGTGASTLNVSTMFDLEPAIPHIIRAEIIESAIPDVHVGQEAEIVPEANPDVVAVGKVVRIAATFGARKLKSDAANEATDERVVEVVVSAEGAPFLIGQRVLVKFMKPGEKAGMKRPAAGATAPAAPSR